MKRIIILLCIFATITSASTPLKVLVTNFEGRGLSQDEVETITDKIRDRMVGNVGIQVVSRADMDAKIAEQEFSQSGACDETKCGIELGKFLSADQLVGGAVSKFDNLYSITIELSDISTSEIVHSISEEFDCTLGELLSIHTQSVVDKIIKSIKEKNTGVFVINTGNLVADLIINDTLNDKTPYNSGDKLTGEYSYRISKENYIPISGKLLVNPNDTVVKQITLQYTPEYKQELSDLIVEEKRRRIIVSRILSGIVTSAAAGLGVYFESKVSDANTSIEQYQQQYDNATTGFDVIKQNISDARTDGEKYTSLRNTMYGVGISGAVALTVTFPLGKGSRNEK